jgi:arabinose-5-phosphate isomerase
MSSKDAQTKVIDEIKRVLSLEAQSILACADRLRDPERARALEQAVLQLQKTLDQGKKIVLTGVGKSGKIAQKIAATLCSTGSLAVYLHPTEGLHGDLGLIQEGDSILALSYTGNSEEILRLVPSFKELKATLIGLGGNPLSTLARESHLWIDVGVEQEACPHNLAPTSSTTLALAMGDAIATTLMKLRGFQAKDFATNHPGGALGKRLHLTVQDVMHSGEKCGIVSLGATVDDVIVLATEKKLGGVIVAENQILKGLITDGDIRRALKHREKLFQMKASDIMTPKPTTASPEMMASEALSLMEKRESQISVLPVVDALGRVKGLVRLHDLVQTL